MTAVLVQQLVVDIPSSTAYMNKTKVYLTQQYSCQRYLHVIFFQRHTKQHVLTFKVSCVNESHIKSRNILIIVLLFSNGKCPQLIVS